MINKNECNYLDIARFLGIWMVVFGHFPFSGNDVFFLKFVYTFHMPMFFMISGILYKQDSFSISNLKKEAISLIIPYFIYNIICAILYFPFTHDNLFNIVKGIILCNGKQASGASWFFLSLFWIRIIALLLKDKIQFILVSFFCIAATVLIQYIDINNIWRIKSAVCMFPFFTVGFLLKEKLSIQKSHIINLIMIIICLCLISLYAWQFGRINPSNGFYGSDIGKTYLVGFAGSLLFLYLSQYLLPLMKSKIIFTISRGTMMIVGLHSLLTTAFKYLTPDLRFYYSFIISLAITLLFYFPIRYTFDRVPILFGKLKNKS